MGLSFRVLLRSEPASGTGALRTIRGAILVPLDEVVEGAAALDRTRPVVVVCR